MMGENSKIGREWSWTQPALFGDGERIIVADDLFHDSHWDDSVREKVFGIIDTKPKTVFILCTAQPENIREFWPEVYGTGTYSPAYVAGGEIIDPDYLPETHRPNVWLLTSVSDQATADAMIPELLKCRDLTPVLGVSAEPLLDRIDFAEWLFITDYYGDPDVPGGCQYFSRPRSEYGIASLDWIITGVESNGKKVGRLDGFASEAGFFDAVRFIDNQCKEAGVAHWPKQMPINGRGSHVPTEWGDGWLQQMPGN